MLKKETYTATTTLKRLNVLPRIDASNTMNMSVFISHMKNHFTVNVFQKTPVILEGWLHENGNCGMFTWESENR